MRFLLSPRPQGVSDSPPEEGSKKNGRLIPQSSIIHTIVDETFLFHQNHTLGLRMLTRFDGVIQ